MYFCSKCPSVLQVDELTAERNDLMMRLKSAEQLLQQREGELVHVHQQYQMLYQQYAALQMHYAALEQRLQVLTSRYDFSIKDD